MAKAVVLSVVGKSLHLSGLALERITGGDERFPISAPSSAVGRIVSRLGITDENLATSISGQQVVMRHIEVPKMTEEELRASIKYETDIHFPFKLEDAIIDFHILERAKGVEENKMKVFMVAARKETVESHLEMLGKANVTPRNISVDAVALVNACEGAVDTTGRSLALANVGASRTIIVVVSDGIFSFSREAEIGCMKLSSAISKGLSISGGEAERIIRERIKDYDSYFSSFVTNIAREIRSSIDYFEERSNSKIDAVYIDGGGSMIGDIDGRLSGEIGLDVKRLDVVGEATAGMEAVKKEEFEGLSSLFTIAYGLASGMSVTP